MLTTPFVLQTRSEGAALIVTLSGGVQIDQGDEFRARLLEVIDGARPAVIIDLSGLEFMGSSGVAAIVAAHAKAESLRCVLHLVQPPAPVRKLLELLRIPDVIPLHPTLAAAVRAAG